MAQKLNKQELVEKINFYAQRILALEKNKSTRLYSKRHESRALYCTLEELELKLFAERKIIKHDIRQEISRIRGNVNSFHRMLSGLKPDALSIEKLKQTMESIEASIVNFKEKQREDYEALLQEEQTLSQEVGALDRKMDSWLAIPRARHLRPGELAAELAMEEDPNVAPDSMPLAILAFERFLDQTGGRQGGWDDYDHRTFLKIRSRYNEGNPAFLEALEKELLTKTVEELREHEQWYTEYMTLLDSKKKSIEEWRERKKNERKKQLEGAAAEEENDEKLSNKQELMEKEREARFAKLEEWKAQQKLRQAQAEEDKLKKELLESKRQERENKRRAVVKSRVEEYAKTKEAEQVEQRLQEEAKRNQELADRRLANKEIEKFRERDMRGVLERRRRAEAKELEKLEKERKLEQLKEQVEVKVERDPSRLLRLTKGWEERRKAEATSAAASSAGSSSRSISGGSQSMPRRAIPSWRQRI